MASSELSGGEAVAVGCTMFFGFIVVMFASVFLESFVAMKMWQWYVVTQLSLPALSFAGTFGVVSLVRLVTSLPSKAEDEVAKLLGFAIARPLLVLTIGYIFSFFV